MEPGGDPFKFMMKSDRLTADLHLLLGDKPVTKLRKCVIIVAGLSADYEMECRTLKNNSEGLNRAEIKHVLRNEYSRLFRQQQKSKSRFALKGTAMYDWGKGKNRRLRNIFEENWFIYGKKGHRTGECRSVKKIEKSGDAAVDKKD